MAAKKARLCRIRMSKEFVEQATLDFIKKLKLNILKLKDCGLYYEWRST